MSTSFAVPTGDAAAGRVALSRRIAAGVIDLAVCVAIFAAFVVAFGEAKSGGGSVSVRVSGAPVIGLLAAWFAYFFLLEWRTGASLGKHALGLRVVSDDGAPPTAGAVAIRTLLRAIDGLVFYLVAVVAIAASPTDQRIGDMAAKTRVVRQS